MRNVSSHRQSLLGLDGFTNTEDSQQLRQVVPSQNPIRERDMWIADTGALNHGTFSDIGGRNVQATESSNLDFSGEAQKVQKLRMGPWG
jgi:hypothetical protein